jgi:polyphosphate kinase 2
MIIYNRTEYKKLTPKQYKKEKRRLQVELLKLQQWIIKNNKRVAIVLEGRDAAGKGSTIKRFIENMMPKSFDVKEMGVPTSYQRRNWFKTWDRMLPKPGNLIFFDRSWYSRATIQPVMGYCSEIQYKNFMKKVNQWEMSHLDNGLILIKLYLSVTKENQEIRFQLREMNPLKYWKLSPNDWKAHKKWQFFTKFKERMFEKTSTDLSPWVVINSNVKMIARLNAMRYVLGNIEYKGKENLKVKKWNQEDPEYEITIDNILFENLSKDQYDFLFEIKQRIN